MLKLLRSNFSRAIKNKTMWISLAVQAIVMICMIIISVIQRKADPNSSPVASDEFLLVIYSLFGIPLQGILISVFGCQIIGADYANGTIRNKLIMGHSRSSIYISNFVTVAVFAILLNIVGLLTVCAIAMPIFGPFKYSAKLIAWIIIDGTAVMLAYAAIVTIVSMLSKSTTASIVICLLTLIIATFVFLSISFKVNQPDMIAETSFNELGELVEVMVPNPDRPKPQLKAFYQFCLDFFPSGQVLQLSKGEKFHDWQMLLYSLGIIAATNAGGCLAFRRLDLK